MAFDMFRRLGRYGAAPTGVMTPPFLESPDDQPPDLDEPGAFGAKYAGGATAGTPPPLSSPDDAAGAMDRVSAAGTPSAASLGARPTKLTAREEYEQLQTPVAPKPSLKRQLGAMALSFVPGARQTGLVDDVLAPGYRQKMAQFNARQADLKRQTEQEDKDTELELKRLQKTAYAENIAALKEARGDNAETRRMGAQTAIQKDMESRMAIPASMPDGRTPALDPDKTATHTLYKAPDGSYWQVPNPDVALRMKAEAQGKDLVDVPAEMREVLGDKATREQIIRYGKSVKEKQDDNFWANKIADPNSTPAERKQGNDYFAAKARAAGQKAQEIHIHNGTGVAPSGTDSYGMGDGSEDDKFAKTVRTKAANNPALDNDAWQYMISGKLLVRGRSQGTQGDVRMIKARASQIMRDFGIDPGELQARAAELKGNIGAFSKISTYAAQIESFEDTLQKNSDVAMKLSDAYKRNDIQFINRIQNAFKTGTGDSEALNLAAQLHGISREWAKIMAGSVSAVGVPISEAKETDAIFDKAMSDGQLASLIQNVVTVDAKNRMDANNAQKAKLLGGIRGAMRGGNPAPQPGGGDKVEVISPEGVKGFIPRANVEKAKQRGFTIVGQ